MAISIAKQFDYYCASNDGLVRKACSELDVKYVGTLGVVGCAFAVQLIGKKPFLEIMSLLLSDDTSCYIKPQLVGELLEKFNLKEENFY